MALKACPECNAQVSDEAASCPACGKQLRRARRTIFGKLCLGAFAVFNVLMVLWFFSAIGAVSHSMETMNEAEKAGASVGAGIGMMLILFVWAAGDIVFGSLAFFTRAKVQ